MKIESSIRGRFRRNTLKRLSADLNEIGILLGVEKFKPSPDFITEIQQALGVGYYEPGTSLHFAFGEGGDLTRHPFFVIALILEFHNRSQSRFRQLTMNVCLSRFGSKYKVRGTVGWVRPLRVKYETGYNLIFPFSALDAAHFENILSNMKSVFIATARRSLQE